MKVAIQLLLLVKFSMLSLRINFPVPLLWLILLNQTGEADSFNSSTDQPIRFTNVKVESIFNYQLELVQVLQMSTCVYKG